MPRKEKNGRVTDVPSRPFVFEPAVAISNFSQTWALLLSLSAALGLPKDKRTKQKAIDDIIKAQNEMGVFNPRVEPFCEMCGRHVMMREIAHIVAEAGTDNINTLWLCPSCHRVLDRHLKLRLYEALKAYKVKGLPESWKTPFGIGRVI